MKKFENNTFLHAIIFIFGLLVFDQICHAKENRIKIGIIDTGVNLENHKEFICSYPESKDFTGSGIKDNNGHGTNIFYLITKGLDSKKYCIVMMKFANLPTFRKIFDFEFYTFNVRERLIKFLFHNEYMDAIGYAEKSNLKYLNLSLGGSDYNEYEQTVIQSMLDNNTRVIVAAGNNHTDLNKDCNYYPACDKFTTTNFHVIGSKSDADQISGFSNYNGPIDNYEYGEHQGYLNNFMNGTSQATANYTNRLIRMENK